MLALVLAFVLCCLHASDTVIITYCYHFYSHNPSGAKLLLLSEVLKLAIASCLWFTEKRAAHKSLIDCHIADLSHSKPATGAAACLTQATGQGGHQQHVSSRQCKSVQASAWTLLVFSIPSLCYFATNNLSFYALTLMSAHLYTILCDLKVVSTCLLNYFLLDRRLNRHAVASLFLLFLGICIGQYATLRAAAGSVGSIAAAAHFPAAGLFLMVLISLVSATASNYTEWVMNYSQYKHESLNLQNMRLYSIGSALNAAYYWQSGGRLQGFFSDVMAPHFAIVMVLALMGLITGVLIKHYGNIVKVYASSTASLLGAWISQMLLQDPPPAMFYAGICLALAATVQLQKARSPESGSADGTLHSKQGSAGRRLGHVPQQQQQHKIQGSLVVPIALAVLVLLFVPQVVPWDRDWMTLPQATGSMHAAGADATTRQLPANLHNPASLVPDSITLAPMPPLPPFQPTCLVRFENRTLLGCPPMNCSLAESCSVDDTSCCAYYNLRMLHAFDRLLLQKGLQGQYTTVYGTALGAARNQSILGHTHDIDMALSATALQILAQNATREQLWRQGYVFWHDRFLWRACPHDQHPAPEFRAAMVHNMTHVDWEAETGSASAVYLDGYLMWHQPDGAPSCAVKFANPDAAIMLQPVAPAAAAAARAAHSPHDLPDTRLQQQQEGEDSGQHRRFCLQQSKTPVDVGVAERPAAVAGLALPVPHNLEEHLSSTYGSGWRVPDTSYHGVTQKAPDWWPIQQALLTRLAVTAWGDMTWPERRSRCDTSKAAATAAADLVAAKDPVITPAAGAGNPASDTKPGPARPQEQQPQDDQAYEAGPLLQATSDSTAGQLSQHPTPMPGQRKIMPS